jgi:DNA repair protein Swi5/Sae3
MFRNDPSETVKRHIRLLHEYNEIKDVGQGLIALIADARGMRQVDVEREFGVCEKD